MQKTYTRINWQNYPSENTPLNESNLNRMDYSLNEVDDRILALDTDKATVTQISTLIRDISVNDETGVITITKQNGQTVSIQTTLNKIAINFAYDYATQTLILTMNDGSTATISLESLIQNNEFANTDTIALSVSQNGIVTGNVVLHSITDEHLRTDYLADIQTAESHADSYQQAAEGFMLNAEAWARGTRGGDPVPSGTQGYNNNSKYYKDQSEAWAVGEVNGVPVSIEHRNYQNNSKYYSEVSASIRDSTLNIRDQAQSLLDSVTDRLTGLNMYVDYNDGCLYYELNSGIRLQIDYETGELLYEIT